MNPVCSICIANYNGVGLIVDCINAVLHQDADFSFEIIVHDDASTDNSVSYIREKFPDIRLIESKENVGFCISNNRLAEAARGQYLLLLNNDAILLPDALRTLHEYAASLPGPAILGLPQYNAETNALLDIGSRTDLFLNSVPNKIPGRGEVAMVAGACLWIPADLWRQIGGFPAWFHTLAEDLYLCSVARLWGYPVQAIPHSGFRHWVGKSVGGGKLTDDRRLSTSFQRRILTERNKVFVISMCYPAASLWVILPLHLLLLQLEGLVLGILKRNPVIWQKIYSPIIPSLWRTRQTIIRYRNSIQRSRKISTWQFFSPFDFIPYKLRMLVKHGLPEIK